jgi:hypothetical protein
MDSVPTQDDRPTLAGPCSRWPAESVDIIRQVMAGSATRGAEHRAD